MLAVVLAWALAGPSSSDAIDPRREQAAAEFALGRQAFERGDPTSALAAFERAQALMPHAKVLSNIALCLAELGRHREAIAAFEDAIARHELTSDEQALAKQHLEASERMLARMNVLADDGGAHRIAIDDRESCTTPCALVLDPGDHRLRMVDGGDARELTLVEGSTTTLRMLAPQAVPPPTVSPKPSARAPEPRAPRPHFGAVGWIGAGLGIVGSAGVLGFGLRARSLHHDYEAEPTDDRRTRGLRARNLANASIAVAAAGGVMLVAELIRMGIAKRPRARSRRLAR